MIVAATMYISYLWILIHWFLKFDSIYASTFLWCWDVLVVVCYNLESSRQGYPYYNMLYIVDTEIKSAKNQQWREDVEVDPVQLWSSGAGKFHGQILHGKICQRDMTWVADTGDREGMFGFEKRPLCHTLSNNCHMSRKTEERYVLFSNYFCSYQLCENTAG